MHLVAMCYSPFQKTPVSPPWYESKMYLGPTCIILHPCRNKLLSGARRDISTTPAPEIITHDKLDDSPQSRDFTGRKEILQDRTIIAIPNSSNHKKIKKRNPIMAPQNLNPTTATRAEFNN